MTFTECLAAVLSFTLVALAIVTRFIFFLFLGLGMVWMAVISEKPAGRFVLGVGSALYWWWLIRLLRATTRAFLSSDVQDHAQTDGQRQGTRYEAGATEQEQSRGHNEPRQAAVDLESEELEHARALGLKGRMSVAEIRSAYRQQVSRYHPDKVQHLGEEFRILASEKTRKINAAYAYFRRKYNIT